MLAPCQERHIRWTNNETFELPAKGIILIKSFFSFLVDFEYIETGLGLNQVTSEGGKQHHVSVST